MSNAYLSRLDLWQFSLEWKKFLPQIMQFAPKKAIGGDKIS